MKGDLPDPLAALDDDEDISIRPVGAVAVAVINGAVVALVWLASKLA